MVLDGRPMELHTSGGEMVLAQLQGVVMKEGKLLIHSEPSVEFAFRIKVCACVHVCTLTLRLFIQLGIVDIGFGSDIQISFENYWHEAHSRHHFWDVGF